MSEISINTAFDYLENEGKCISTSCQLLDDNLGGGIPLGSVMELCGLPGSGKTQMW